MKRILSLGAGVQSSTLLLMSEIGELPKLDAAIFADTGWEPKRVYEHLDWLQKNINIPIEIVSSRNIRDYTLEGIQGRHTFPQLPFHTFKQKPSMLQRQCTKNYKLVPLRSAIRKLWPKQQIELWIGISREESFRQKDSPVKYIHHRWPLIEKSLTRYDCLRWLKDHGFPPPPKSACIGCPFCDDGRWRDMKLNRPGEWQDAIEFDQKIRHHARLEGEFFLHRSLKPLDEVDLSTPEDHGQLNLFNNECEGMCGT